ncbi:MAG TPA: SRPBCC family protein [Vicinamibacterales bacterium]|nr:SRPBCC family protein [Vicinamibacterales bacterium]
MAHPSETQRATGALARPHRNISDLERYVSGAAAAALAIGAVRQRSGASWLLAAASAVLGYRAVAGHCPAYAAAGISTYETDTRDALSGSRGVHAEAEIVVARPVSELFSFWRRLENLPAVMRHLVSVREIDGRRSHWVARAPLGSTVEWDAEIINEVPDKVIGWRSLEGSSVVTAGSVSFEPVGTDSTRIRVKLQYNPPGGRVGSWAARLFGEEPNIQIREDLERFKQAMEAKSTAKTGPALRASDYGS